MIFTAEYIRQSRKADKEAQAIEDRYLNFEKRIEELEYLNNKQEAELKAIQRIVYAKENTKK